MVFYHKALLLWLYLQSCNEEGLGQREVRRGVADKQQAGQAGTSGRRGGAGRVAGRAEYWERRRGARYDKCQAK